jgi:hypothetical protein
MARITCCITAPPSVAGGRTRYTPFEVRCIHELSILRWQPRSLRRWLRLRWWLFVSSERVIRHIRACTRRGCRAAQRHRR